MTPVCNGTLQLRSYSSSFCNNRLEVKGLQEETAKDLKEWLRRGGVQVSDCSDAVRTQLANRSRRDA